MITRRVAVRGVIVKDNKLLCVRQKVTYDETETRGKDFWCTPGGGLDAGETLVAGLERELIEELGVKPVVGKLVFIQQFQYETTEQLEFFFEVTNATDYEQIDLTATSHGKLEIAEVAFINPLKENIMPLFLRRDDLVEVVARGVPEIHEFLPQA